MSSVELFFDHTCPYCYRAHKFLKELRPDYPGVTVVWRPVEAHPKVEEPEHTPYEDLAVMGALYVRERCPERETAYHDSVYESQFVKGRNVDDIEVLLACAADAGIFDADADNAGADAKAFREAVLGGRYKSALDAANAHAYEECGVWAVPAYVCGDKRLDAASGIGVSKAALTAFLKSLTL